MKQFRPTIVRLFLMGLLLAVSIRDAAAQSVPAASPAPSEAAVSGSDSAAKSGDGSGNGGNTTTGSADAGSPVSAGSSSVDSAKKAELELPPPPPPPPPKVPHESRQYKVQIPVVFGLSPQMNPAFKREVLNELNAIAERSIGSMWILEIVEADWIAPLNRAGIERLQTPQIRQRVLERRMAAVVLEQLVEHGGEKFKAASVLNLTEALLTLIRTTLAESDKTRQRALSDQMVAAVAGSTEIAPEALKKVRDIVFLYLLPSELDLDKMYPVAIEQQGCRFLVSSREWDRESEIMTEVRSRSTMDRRAVATEVFRLIADLFHPVVQIDDAKPDAARLRVKAGDYRPADPAFVQARTGSIFAPFFRYLDKNRVVQKIQPLPWSYITVKEIENARLQCRMDVGISTPLGAFRRRRMELRAIQLKPAYSATTLNLAPRRTPDKPLVGYLVAVYNEPPPPPKPPTKADNDAAASKKEDDTPPASGQPTAAEVSESETSKPLIFRSSRLGQVTVPVDPGHSLRWLYIRSGSALLAKFPFVAGVEPNMMVECPDDTIRLDVEGQVVLLQTRLIDTIARRVTLMALAKSRAKKNEWQKVDESLAALKTLPAVKDFESQVTEIQFPAIKKAEARKDKRTVGKVKSLGKDVLKVAGIYLDQEKLDDFRAEMEELRRLEKNDPTDPTLNTPRAAPGQR